MSFAQMSLRANVASRKCHSTKISLSAKKAKLFNHREKTRVQMPAKMFTHLKLLCWLFMGPTPGFDTKQRNSFLIKFGGVFYNKNKILTLLFIVKYEKITL